MTIPRCYDQQTPAVRRRQRRVFIALSVELLVSLTRALRVSRFLS
jgi:hypothetical protein